MTTSKLGTALTAYREALDALEQSPQELDPAVVLAALTARDAVARALTDKQSDAPADLLAVVELDDRLRKLAGAVVKAVKLADWRASLRPPPEAWWWSLESAAPPDPADRFGWLWSALAVLCLTASLSLMAEISRRFLSGGPDVWGAFATLSQAALTLLAAGGALTKAGREAVERILSSLNIPGHFRQVGKLIMALVLLVALFGLWFSLPSIARFYNNRGYRHHQAGRLTSALYDLRRAISLNPDYTEAHYNLGLLYEDLLETESAQAEYQVAAGRGLEAAYNNLARLYILRDKPSEAISRLLSGLSKAQDTAVRYTMLKNLGWARLEQERYDEAIAWLHKAVDLAPESAAAHCLLAQALEGRDDAEGAASEWETCLKLARSGESAEEDGWIGQARQFFATPTPVLTPTVTPGG
jgi:tetratricopeptide (TPR) repeat protein